MISYLSYFIANQFYVYFYNSHLSLADLIQFDILCLTVGPGLGITGVKLIAELIFPGLDDDDVDDSSFCLSGEL